MGLLRSVNEGLDALATKIAGIDKRVAFVCIVLLVIPLFRPDILSHTDQRFFVDLYKYWGLASGVCSTLLFVVMGRRGAFAYLAVALVASVLASTVMFDGSIGRWFVYWLPSAIMALLVASTCRHYYRELLTAVLLVTAVLEIANFITVLLFPEGVWTTERVGDGNYFFDHRNNAYKLLIPMITCSVLLDRLGERRLTARTAFFVALSFAQVTLGPSATSLLALGVFAFFLLVVQWKLARGFVNGLTMLVASISASALVVVMRVQDMFGFFVEGVLHKSLTFTGRTFIWDRVFELFSGIRHSLFGYGVSGYKELILAGQSYSHAHNEFLDVWLNGGLISLVVLVCLLVVVAFALFNMRMNYDVAVLAVSMGAYFVVGLTEPLISTSFIFITSLAFYRVLSLRFSRRPTANVSRGACSAMGTQ